MNQKDAYNHYVGSIEWHNINVKEMDREGTNWSHEVIIKPLSFKDWKKQILPENKLQSIEMANILTNWH